MGVAGAVGIAGAVAFGLVYDDPKAGDDNVESYEFGPQLRRLLRMPSVRAAAAAGFVMVSAQFCLVSYLLPFLRSETGIAPERGAVALFAVQGCGIAGRIVLAAWSDRTAHRLIPVATAAIAAAIAVAALPPAAGRLELPLLVTYAGVLGFFAFGWYGPWVVHVAELAQGRSVGLTLTVAMTANQLGIAAGPPLFGLALDLGGYSVAWGILAAGLLLISVTTFRRARWAEVSR